MSNLITVFAPDGSKHEVSRPNFLDLTRHYGWTTSPPAPVPKDKKHETEFKPAAITQPANSGETSDGVATGSDVDDGAGLGEGEGSDGGADGVLSSAEEKAALIADLKERFDYDADKRLSVTKLKAKLVDLETNAADGE